MLLMEVTYIKRSQDFFPLCQKRHQTALQILSTPKSETSELQLDWLISQQKQACAEADLWGVDSMVPGTLLGMRAGGLSAACHPQVSTSAPE